MLTSLAFVLSGSLSAHAADLRIDERDPAAAALALTEALDEADPAAGWDIAAFGGGGTAAARAKADILIEALEGELVATVLDWSVLRSPVLCGVSPAGLTLHSIIPEEIDFMDEGSLPSIDPDEIDLKGESSAPGIDPDIINLDLIPADTAALLVTDSAGAPRWVIFAREAL